MTDVNGKRVLLTGAASGIGRLMAARLAERGAQMILWDLDEVGLGRLEKELVGRGHTVDSYVCDVGDRRAVKNVAAKVLDELGAVDVLINNAGVVSGKTILEADDEDILRTFNVNTLALFWVTRAFLPEMVRRNSGHVVTIASAAGITGTSKLTDYSASKFAAFGFDESLRLEMRRLGHKIRTTIVCPFYISTGMFEGVKTRFSFLLPILEPDYAADEIVKAIEENKKRLVMPRFVMTTFPLRIAPTSLFDSVVSLLGANQAMDDFTGRPKQQPAFAEKEPPKKRKRK